MKVVIAAVVSLDGKLTQGDNPDVRSWASGEDAAHFSAMLKQYQLQVMGRKTYELMRPSFSPTSKKLRVVLTRHPQDFASEAAAGRIEFTSETPQALVSRLEAAGHTDLLLLGGGETFAAYLQAGVVTDIYLTLEPLMFGTGTPFLAAVPVSTKLRLESSQQLNDRGTLLLHYIAHPSA